MRKIIRIGSVIALIAAIAGMASIYRQYRIDRDQSQLFYTGMIKKHDILDAARNAMAALDDASVEAQDYILTGETVYSEAYAADLRTWQDESGTLGLIVVNDKAAGAAQDFSKAGTRTLDELAAMVSLYEKTGREAALERIRRSSGIVYLNQTRAELAKIKENVGGNADGNITLIVKFNASLLHGIEGAGAFFLLTLGTTVLLVLEIRRKA
jgi:CHASE3 domain sensor protein